MIRLYGYFRSSASWRVRAALAFKGIPFEQSAVHLLKAEHVSPEHLARNPLGTVPLLEVTHADGTTFRLGESLAILHYLEETHPAPSILPGNAEQRAMQRWMAEVINAGTHPLQNLGTLKRLEGAFNADDAARKAWAQHFITRGFTAVETLMKTHAGTHCVGNALSMADLCVVPQLYNARRFGLDLSPFPTLVRVCDALMATAPFHGTHPDRQPDTPAAA